MNCALRGLRRFAPYKGLPPLAPLKRLSLPTPAGATTELGHYQHKQQRLENRIRYYTEGERKKRNHRLITRGAAVESIVPEVRGMSERDFFILMEQVFSLPKVAALVSQAADQQEDGGIPNR